MIGHELPIREYWAIPDAIPETCWLVVAVRDDKIARRKGKPVIVATFDTYDEAYEDAERRTALASIVSV